MTTIHTSALKRVKAYGDEIHKIMFQNEQIWPGEIEQPIDYFCFSSDSPQTFKIIGPYEKNYDIDIVNVYYSYDQENWNYISFSKNRQNYTRESNYINFGGSYGNVYLRGKNELGFGIYSSGTTANDTFRFVFGNSSGVVVSGSTRSLLDWECMNSDPTVNFTWQGGGFGNIFYKCSQIIDASNLKIYADGRLIFEEMFYKCSNLVNAPQIIMPSTLNTYSNRTFQSMFQNCSSLVNAPELSALKLSERCYNGIFWGCSNLSYVKMMATDISADQCLTNWLYGVSSSGTFVKNANATWDESSVIPSGWTVQTATS